MLAPPRGPAALRWRSAVGVAGLLGLLVWALAPLEGAADGKSGLAGPGPVPQAGRGNFLPLSKGRYWLYEARDSGSNSVGLKQMLVSDQKPAGNATRATDFVVSTRDQTVPPEERADAPTILRLHEDGSIECVDCGGVILPAQFNDGSTWRSSAGDWCSLTKAPMTFRTADKRDHHAVIVQCSSDGQGTTSTRVYADGVGVVLALYREQRSGKWVERVERLKEFRTINPPRLPPPP